MKRIAYIAFGILCFAVLWTAQAKAVTLVTPTGQPVGGKWQAWANEAKVPTVAKLVLDVSEADAQGSCGGADACSYGWQPGTERETVVAPNAGRRDFYYELGHQFDWQRLKGANRQYLAREWGAPHAHWLDSQASIDAGSEDGLEAVFPDIYADCALGVNDQGDDISVGFVGKKYSPPGVTPKINTCSYLVQVAHSRTWTWTLWSKVPAPTTTF